MPAAFSLLRPRRNPVEPTAAPKTMSPPRAHYENHTNLRSTLIPFTSQLAIPAAKKISAPQSLCLILGN
jgi:hypothetical protein